MGNRRRLLALAAAAALLAAACGGGDDGVYDDNVPVTEPTPPVILATTSILGDIARNVAGDRAQVEALMPAGTDPHDFEPSIEQVNSLYRANLVVANGFMLEEGMTEILDIARGEGVNLFEAATAALGESGEGEHEEGAAAGGSTEEEGHEGEEAGEGHEHGGRDPHFWLDPVLVAEGALALGEKLEAFDGSEEWREQAQAYADRMTALDGEIREILAAVPAERRKLVTNHDAFGYFAERYGFQVLGAVIPSTSSLAEPSSAHLAELAELIAEQGAPAIFVENEAAAGLADAVAAEVGSGVRVVELYAGWLGEPGSGADTLEGMLRVNAQRIAEALS